jgi:hypothetical protein
MGERAAGDWHIKPQCMPLDFYATAENRFTTIETSSMPRRCWDSGGEWA